METDCIETLASWSLIANPGKTKGVGLHNGTTPFFGSKESIKILSLLCFSLHAVLLSQPFQKTDEIFYDFRYNRININYNGVFVVGKNITFPSITQTEGYYLVKDFQTFMEYLFREGAYLTKKSRQIAPKFLYSLNQKVTYPTEDVKPRSKQATYHELHLLQHLAEAAKLYEKTSGPNGNFKLIPTERYKQFCVLTETEQYFTLLETFWINVNWRKLTEGRHGRMVMNELHYTFDVLSRQQTGMKLPIDHIGSEINYVVSILENFVAYFSYFGFWEVEQEYEMDNGYQLKGEFKAQSITVTEFGKQMMKCLTKHRPILDWNTVDQQANQQYTNNMSTIFDDIMEKIVEEAAFEQETGNSNRAKLQKELEVMVEKEQEKTKTETEHKEPFIQPFISIFSKRELQKTLTKPVKEWKGGAYTFKVILGGGVWRRIEMKDTHSLDDLHYAIQQAFDFGNDHLYAFYMDGRRFSDNYYNAPMIDEGPYADEAWLGDLDLVKGQEFLYLFDFGDEWNFNVKLEKIDPQSVGPEQAQIIASKGEPPEQYAW